MRAWLQSRKFALIPYPFSSLTPIAHAACAGAGCRRRRRLTAQPSLWPPFPKLRAQLPPRLPVPPTSRSHALWLRQRVSPTARPACATPVAAAASHLTIIIIITAAAAAADGGRGLRRPQRGRSVLPAANRRRAPDWPGQARRRRTHTGREGAGQRE
jgi:hypothetical protein